MTNNEKQDSSFVVINVLDKELYDDCHIAGSVHVPFDQVLSYVHDMSKDTEIVLYCSNYACGTSEFVATQLQKSGYTNVYVYEGGTAEWLQEGFPVEGPAKSAYLTHKIEKPETYSGLASAIDMHELAKKLKCDIHDMQKAA